MKKFITFLLFAFSISFQAQNVAYIQQDSILASIPNYKISLQNIEQSTKNYQDEIKKSKDQWTGKLEKLLKPYNVKENEDLKTIKSRMSNIDTTSLSILIDEDKILTKKAQNYEAVLKMQYQKEVQPMLEKVNKILENYAIKNKLDLIYIIEQLRPALAYIDKKKNITKQIIALLK